MDRTATELERHAEQLVSVIYRKIMYDYLCQVTYFLVNYTHIDNEKIKAIVLPSIFDGGSRKAPEVNYQTQLFKNTYPFASADGFTRHFFCKRPQQERQAKPLLSLALYRSPKVGSNKTNDKRTFHYSRGFRSSWSLRKMG